MAAGDTKWFLGFVERTWDADGGDFGATPNSVKCALIKSAANGGIDPSQTEADPCWGAGGTTTRLTPGGLSFTTIRTLTNPRSATWIWAAIKI